MMIGGDDDSRCRAMVRLGGSGQVIVAIRTTPINANPELPRQCAMTGLNIRHQMRIT